MTTAQTSATPAPNAQPPAGAAAPQPKPSLDTLLEEFDASKQPPAQPARPAAAATPPAAAPAASAPSNDANSLNPSEVAEWRRERTNREVDGIVESVRGESEFLKTVDPDVVFGFLQGLGARDPRFRAAFLQRTQKPDQWASVLKAAAGKLEEKLRPTASAPSTETRAAVIAAARQSGAAPRQQGEKTPQEVRAMSDRELKAYKRQLAAGGRR